MKIAVIDNEERVRRAVSSALGDLGYGDVESYAGPVEFRNSYGTCPQVGLIVTDLNMPAGNGLDLISALSPEYVGGVIVMSGWTENEYMHELGKYPGAKERIGAFLKKPISMQALEAAIKQVVGS